MPSSWVALGTGASEGLTGRSTSGCPGWAYTGFGSEYKIKHKLHLSLQTDDTHVKLHQTCLKQKIYSLKHSWNNTADTHVKVRTSALMKCLKQAVLSHRRLHTNPLEAQSVLSAEVEEKGSRVLQAERNVRLDQLIRFIFPWLRANSARLSRRLDPTFIFL